MAEEEPMVAVSDLDLSFCEEVASQPGGEHIRRCFACGTCAAGCPVTEVDPAYNPRKIIRQVLFGMRKEVLSSPQIWYCLVCYRCYARCPQKVNFTDVMRALRYLAIKGRHVPGDMQKRLEDIDRFAQTLRHDLVGHGVSGRAELLEAFRNKVEERIGSAKS
jgi:heterodisulfide reductase subunit C